MISVPKKAMERITAGLKRFQPILSSAKARDVNESDTVTIVTDTLSVIFGYDKYAEITSEYAIRNTYCDLAIKIEGKVRLLIEVKAIGLTLKEQYVKQAIDYAANEGIEWVVLTTGVLWDIYRVAFEKPIRFERILSIDLLEINTRQVQQIEPLGLLAKEGLTRSALDEFHTRQQVISPYVIAALLEGDDAVNLIRRELRKLSPDAKVTPEEIRSLLREEVLKRGVVEGDKPTEARKKVEKAAKKRARASMAEPAPTAKTIIAEETSTEVASPPAIP